MGMSACAALSCWHARARAPATMPSCCSARQLCGPSRDRYRSVYAVSWSAAMPACSWLTSAECAEVTASTAVGQVEWKESFLGWGKGQGEL